MPDNREGRPPAGVAAARDAEARLWRDILRRDRDGRGQAADRVPRAAAPEEDATLRRARFARALARDAFGRHYWDEARERELRRALARPRRDR